MNKFLCIIVFIMLAVEVCTVVGMRHDEQNFMGQTNGKDKPKKQHPAIARLIAMTRKIADDSDRLIPNQKIEEAH